MYTFSTLFIQQYNTNTFKHPWVKGIHFIQMKGQALFQREIIAKQQQQQNSQKNLKSLLGTKQFGYGDSSLFK